MFGVLPALDTTLKLGESAVYVTHSSCKCCDLPPQDTSEGEGHRDVDRCE